MKRLFMSFDLERQKQIRKVAIALFCATILAILTFVAIRLIRDQATAVTPDGANVTVTQGTQYDYGEWSTHKYTVSTSDGNVTGFCVEPKKSNPSGSYKSNITSNTTKNKKIKLALWAYRSSSQTAKDLMEDLNSGQTFADTNYAYIHALVGYIYTNGNDTSGLTEAEKGYLINASNILTDNINADTDAWVLAKGWQLYELGDVSSDKQNVMWIENNRQYTSIEVQKCDTLNTSCKPAGSADLSGVVFQLIYSGTTGAYDGNRGGVIYRNGYEVATGTTDQNGNLQFSNIPLGKYTVREIASNNPAIIYSGTEVEVDASRSDVIFYANFQNEIVRGDLTFQKTDDEGRPMANIPFRITSRTTGENHIVVTNSDGIVDTAQYQHSNHTNGYDSMDVNSITNLGYGTWFGKDGNAQTPVDNSLGALPYDTYDIVEISCNNNNHCYDINTQTKSFTVNQLGTVDLGVWENECVDFSIGTTATDNSDGDKIISANGDAQIKDTIEYCVKRNTTFTVVGNLVLVDPATGESQTLQGEGVSQRLTLTPGNNECGTTEMIFAFDATQYAGKNIVVTEVIYSGTSTTGTPVASHTNIRDTQQTVSVYSLATKATDNFDGNKSIIAKEDEKIKDTVDYCLTAGKEFTIKGVLMDKKTKEKVLVNGEPVTSSVAITPEQNCGTTEIIFDIDASELAGRSIVVFESAYYSETEVETHEDFEDEDQIIDVFSLGTTAVDMLDGDKEILANSEAEIKDTIKYCLKAGQEYTIKGILMDKTTGEPFPLNGSFVEESLTFTPEENCGEVEMFFKFDASHLNGAEIVVFESVYQKKTSEEDPEEEEEELIIEHKNIEDEAQTVHIYLPPPDTGLFTAPITDQKVDDTNNNSFVLIFCGVAVLAGSYIAYRLVTKRKAARFN